jgi:hypothetical protein
VVRGDRRDRVRATFLNDATTVTPFVSIIIDGTESHPGDTLWYGTQSFSFPGGTNATRIAIDTDTIDLVNLTQTTTVGTSPATSWHVTFEPLVQ